MTFQTRSKMRSLAFSYLSRTDKQWLRGKEMLVVGCGSGREIAELWLKLDGDIHITATDIAAALVKLSEAAFDSYLDSIKPKHPPVTDANRPIYQIADAVDLPFADASFDTVFYSTVLHWTSSPQNAINEIVRVVKPGGLIFGAQAIKPGVRPNYANLMFTVNEGTHGLFWEEEYRGWYAAHNINLDIATPIGLVIGRKPI